MNTRTKVYVYAVIEVASLLWMTYALVALESRAAMWILPLVLIFNMAVQVCLYTYLRQADKATALVCDLIMRKEVPRYLVSEVVGEINQKGRSILRSPRVGKVAWGFIALYLVLGSVTVWHDYYVAAALMYITMLIYMLNDSLVGDIREGIRQLNAIAAGEFTGR